MQTVHRCLVSAVSSVSCPFIMVPNFGSRKVTILEDTEQNIHLKNLSVLQSNTEEEALNFLFLGDTNRMIAEVSCIQ